MKHRILDLLMLSCAAFALLSCSLMHEDDHEEECTPRMLIRFDYDRNLKWADAFDSEVEKVTLYAFDSTGRLAFTRTADKAQLDAANHCIDITDEVNASSADSIYTFVAWAEGADNGTTPSYDYTSLTTGLSTETDLSCRISRAATERNVERDITPLFHARLEADTLRLVRGETRIDTLHLTKDTKNVRIVLQNLSGEDIDADLFTFQIDDNNSRLGFDNNILTDTPDSVRYGAWLQQSAKAQIEDPMLAHHRSTVLTAKSAVVAQLTTNRLVLSNRPMLRIYERATGKRILSIPFIDYVLLAKQERYTANGRNHTVSDQDYLDRQDDYELVFFLDDDHSWLSAVIYINSWRIVNQDTGL